MRIKCLSKQIKTENQKNNYDNEFLEINKEYNVYGMLVDDGQVYYYTCDHLQDDYPLAMPDSLFEIVENHLSRFWVFFSAGDGLKKKLICIFPEWIAEPYFQDKLTDWEVREVKIFKTYKELMDLEFPNPSIIETAEIADSQWLMCPLCIDAWESSNDRDGMVRCPKCKTIMHNPRYLSCEIKFT